MKANPALLGFNRGEVSINALLRTDLEAMRLSAEEQVNWALNSLGPMSLRPGFGFLGNTYNNSYSHFIPFINTFDDTAVVELSSEGIMRIWEDDVVLSREANSTALYTDFLGWTKLAEDACEVTTGPALLEPAVFLTNGYNKAGLRRSVSVATVDQPKVHGVRIVVSQGPIEFQIGTSTILTDDILQTTTLATGVHSLDFIPNDNNIYFLFESQQRYPVVVDSIEIEASGNVEIPTQWDTRALVDSARIAKTGSVIFTASNGLPQKRIERRGPGSWSLVTYETNDGPFDYINTGSIAMSASALTGSCELLAGGSFFRPGHVGSIIRLSSAGQTVIRNLAGDGQSTGMIRSFGIDAANDFKYVLAGTWVATVAIEYSLDDGATWVEHATRTINGTITMALSAKFDNLVSHWRLTIKAGTYVSGVVEATLLNPEAGSIDGIARITNVEPENIAGSRADAIILKDFGSLNFTLDWYPPVWSGETGFPSAIAMFESRLTFAGAGTFYGSAVDLYSSFTDENPDLYDAPIDRSIGQEANAVVPWMLPLSRVVIGTTVSEVTAKSNSFDEPMTLANMSLKAGSDEGSANVQAVKMNDEGVFVGKCQTRLFRLAFNAENNNYVAKNLTPLYPELSGVPLLELAIQRQPDTRVHAIQEDGVIRSVILNQDEEVVAPIRTIVGGVDAEVEDIVILPGRREDKVYISVKRTINGNTVRSFERQALESECIGGDVSKLADCFVVREGSPTTTVSAPHLPNESVVVWGDGMDLGTIDLNGAGNGTLPVAVSKYVVGFEYSATYISRKLVEGAAKGYSSLNQLKRVASLGLVLQNTHYQGLQFGRSLETLEDMPSRGEDGDVIPDHTVLAHSEGIMLPFNGDFSTDPRICLKATAPRPATVLGISIGYDEGSGV